jgi:hypothetical protein
MKTKSKAGRKLVLDKKIPVVLMVEGSRVIGKSNLPFDKTNTAHIDKLNTYRAKLYKSC